MRYSVFFHVNISFWNLTVMMNHNGCHGRFPIARGWTWRCILCYILFVFVWRLFMIPSIYIWYRWNGFDCFIGYSIVICSSLVDCLLISIRVSFFLGSTSRAMHFMVVVTRSTSWYHEKCLQECFVQYKTCSGKQMRNVRAKLTNCN
jgi:hypothetical protein